MRPSKELSRSDFNEAESLVIYTQWGKKRNKEGLRRENKDFRVKDI